MHTHDTNCNDTEVWLYKVIYFISTETEFQITTGTEMFLIRQSLDSTQPHMVNRRAQPSLLDIYLTGTFLGNILLSKFQSHQTRLNDVT